MANSAPSVETMMEAMRLCAEKPNSQNKKPPRKEPIMPKMRLTFTPNPLPLVSFPANQPEINPIKMNNRMSKIVPIIVRLSQN